MSKSLKILLIPLLVLGFMSSVGAGDDLEFHDVRAQTEEFLRYNDEIELDAGQLEVFRDALTPLAAPCCCPCNQRRTWHGLTKYLIAEKGLDAEATRAKVAEWFAFTHPNGNSGDACYRGACAKPFTQDGCGGMVEGQVIFEPSQ
jgi:hypothetical protein